MEFVSTKLVNGQYCQWKMVALKLVSELPIQNLPRVSVAPVLKAFIITPSYWLCGMTPQFQFFQLGTVKWMMVHPLPLNVVINAWKWQSETFALGNKIIHFMLKHFTPRNWFTIWVSLYNAIQLVQIFWSSKMSDSGSSMILDNVVQRRRETLQGRVILWHL
jgi:hypothetical protein